MPRTERYKLIDWVLNDDMEGLEEASQTFPCGLCGRPTRTFSLGFCSSMHLRCNVRLWESLEPHGCLEHANRMLDLYRGDRPADPEDTLPF